MRSSKPPFSTTGKGDLIAKLLRSAGDQNPFTTSVTN
jgi:hypothetical protein